MTTPTHRHGEESPRLAVVVAGHTGDVETVLASIDNDDPTVRASALTALERLGRLDDEVLSAKLGDPDSAVRRRCAELAAKHPGVDLFTTLHDADPLVTEMAAWACGEQGSVSDAAMDRLVHLAGHHEDALVREAAVASLGALQDERGLDAILAACRDKPAVRRRAVLALAPFSGDRVDEALRVALEDRDWQVRQAAEDVIGPQDSGRGTFDDQHDSEHDEQE